jgi:excinuclease ABC subunit B
MQKVIDESERRREIQERYNKEHGITPTTIYKSMDEVMLTTSVADAVRETEQIEYKRKGDWFDTLDKGAALDMMKNEMLEAADNLEFEKAAKLRDEIEKLRGELVAE